MSDDANTDEDAGTDVTAEAAAGDAAAGAAAFYSYQSASSHTGFEAVGASRMYLYRDTTTGLKRIRAGRPTGWTAGDKTGTG